jgi:hypothetical protein
MILFFHFCISYTLSKLILILPKKYIFIPPCFSWCCCNMNIGNICICLAESLVLPGLMKSKHQIPIWKTRSYQASSSPLSSASFLEFLKLKSLPQNTCYMLISEKYEIPEKNPISCLYIFTNIHGFYIAFSFYDWWSALKMLHRLHRTLFKASQWTRMKKNSNQMWMTWEIQ